MSIPAALVKELRDQTGAGMMDAKRALETIEDGGTPEQLETQRAELVARLGENIVVVDAARLEAREGESLAEYVHPPANKIGVLVRVKGESPVAARQLAMHISFAQPRYLARDEISDEDVQTEREI